MGKAVDKAGSTAGLSAPGQKGTKLITLKGTRLLEPIGVEAVKTLQKFLHANRSI